MREDRFILSYSGGKDAALACDRAIRTGAKPVGAVTTFDRKNDCSWFHRLPETILRKAEQSLGIPLKIIDTEAERYAEDFETALYDYKNKGAAAAVFGDIDIREHFDWCDRRCRNVGLKSRFPLWNEDRKKILEELIDRGFKAVITTVDTSRMDAKFLGETLTKELLVGIAAEGVDPCGENGEYHTFVYEGPIFRHKIEFNTENPSRTGKYVYLPLK